MLDLVSRAEEQRQLQILNDRLRAHIQQIRRLEFNNDHLQNLVKLLQAELNGGKDDLRAVYEDQLKDLRNQLSNLAKEKAQERLEKSNIADKYEKAIKNMPEMELRIRQLEDKVFLHTKENGELRSRNAELTEHLKRKDDQINDLANELNVKLKEKTADFDNRIASLNANLDNEKDKNAELVQLIENLKDELTKQAEAFEKELEIMKRNKAVLLNMCPRNDELLAKYEEKCNFEIEDLRKKMELRKQEYEQLMEQRYKAEIDDLKVALTRYHEFSKTVQNDFIPSSEQIEGLNSEIKRLQNLNRDLESKLGSTRDDFLKLQRKYDQDMRDRNKRLEEMEQDKNKLKADFDKLFDIKISLERELEIYKKLLDDEEKRIKFMYEEMSTLRGVSTLNANASDFSNSMMSFGNLKMGENGQNGELIAIDNVSDEDTTVLHTSMSGRTVAITRPKGNLPFNQAKTVKNELGKLKSKK